MRRGVRSVIVGAATWSAFFAGSAFVGLSFLPISQAHAQEAEAGRIRAILVEGNSRVEPATVASYLSVKPGDPFDPEQLDISFKTLFATGFFSDVALEREGDDLFVRVTENPIINKISFEGNRALQTSSLEKEIQIKPRSIFTAAKVQTDVQKILELYRRAGRFAANVTPAYKKLDQNRVDVIFEITDGPTTGVRAINFLGNKHYSDAELRNAIVTKQSRLWRFLSSNDNYDPDRLEYDREQVRKYYLNRGYADFRVLSAVAQLSPNQKDFLITFKIDEGQRFKFGEIKVETKLNKLSTQALRKFVNIDSGKLYRADQIEKAIEALEGAAGLGGYRSVEVVPQVRRNRETKTVDITFVLDEGPRAYIDRIDVQGNTQTVDSVIRRELRLVEGDAYNKLLIERSRNRIRALGYFKDVEIEETQGSTPDRTNLQVKVTEQPTGELSVGAGFSSFENFFFNVQVSQRNLRGRGQFLRLLLSASSRSQQADLAFTEPRFLGRNLQAGFNIFTVRSNFIREAGFTTQSSGFSINTGFPLTEDTSLGISYRLQFDNIGVDDVLCSDPIQRSAICDQRGNFVTSVIGYSFRWDRRNDPIEPTRGWDLSFRQEYAGLGGDVRYLRTQGDLGFYRGLFPGFIASLNLSAGYITSLGNGTVRINDRFFRGGGGSTANFRGFDVAGIGPRTLIATVDPNDPRGFNVQRGNALGGKFFNQATAELSFPTGLPKEFGVTGSVFVEAGTLGFLDAPDRPSFTFVNALGQTQQVYVNDAASLRASYGISIFWVSPFGPVRFDFAVPFVFEAFDQQQGFQFTTGMRF